MGYRLPVRIKKGLEIQGMNKLKLTDMNLIFLITIIYITEFETKKGVLRSLRDTPWISTLCSSIVSSTCTDSNVLWHN